MTSRDYAVDYMLFRPEPKWMADERLAYCEQPEEKKSLRSALVSLFFSILA